MSKQAGANLSKQYAVKYASYKRFVAAEPEMLLKAGVMAKQLSRQHREIPIL
jgi:hypothetical protein